MKTTKVYVVMIFAMMQTGLVFSMEKQDAHQAVIAYNMLNRKIKAGRLH